MSIKVGDIDDRRKAWLLEIVGQPIGAVMDAVNAGGGEVRVYRVNGHARICTRDYNPNRVNLDVSEGVVVGGHYG